MTKNKSWNFVHHVADGAAWTPGLRDIFEYRDLGIKACLSPLKLCHY